MRLVPAGASGKLALELTHLVMPKEVYNALIDRLMTNMGASMPQAGAK